MAGDGTDKTPVATQFQKSWRHRTPCPPVRAIYKIFNTEASVRQYELYRWAGSQSRTTFLRFTEFFGCRDSVEARGNFVAMGRSPGNENRRWHGTRRRCNIGDTGITNFCADQRCALCNIIRSSFNLRYFGRATGWGRFGAGIYTSSTSSKFVLAPPNVSLGVHLMLRSPPSGLIAIQGMLVSLPSGRLCY